MRKMCSTKKKKGAAQKLYRTTHSKGVNVTNHAVFALNKPFAKPLWSVSPQNLHNKGTM
jgi:hypothetical protein